MYNDLVKRLRATVGNRDEKCDCCPYEEDYPCCVDCLDKMHKQAADAIETMCEMVATAHFELANVIQSYEESKPRWVPVTERLPKYGDWVLGIGPKHGYHVCEYRGITHFPYSGDSPWFSAKGRTLTITHWMPLPPPPKEDK